MTERAQPAGSLVAAVQNASRAALVMAVVAVALVGTDVSVAVSRTAGSSAASSAASAATNPIINARPGIAVTSTPFPAATTSHPPVTPSPSDEAAGLLAKAVADALSKGYVHAVAHDTSQNGTLVFDDYDGPDGGVQHLSIRGGHVVIRVLGPTTYYTGDKRGLRSFVGFSSDEVAVLHHRWIRLVAGMSGYAAMTAGVTIAAMLHDDRIAAPLKLLPARTRDGVDAVGISGHVPRGGAPNHGIATMWITTGDNPLPIEFDASNHHQQLTQIFEAWGTPFHVTAPRNIFDKKTVAG